MVDIMAAVKSRSTVVAAAELFVVQPPDVFGCVPTPRLMAANAPFAQLDGEPNVARLGPSPELTWTQSERQAGAQASDCPVPTITCTPRMVPSEPFGALGFRRIATARPVAPTVEVAHSDHAHPLPYAVGTLVGGNIEGPASEFRRRECSAACDAGLRIYQGGHRLLEYDADGRSPSPRQSGCPDKGLTGTVSERIRHVTVTLPLDVQAPLVKGMSQANAASIGVLEALVVWGEKKQLWKWTAKGRQNPANPGSHSCPQRT